MKRNYLKGFLIPLLLLSLSSYSQNFGDTLQIRISVDYNFDLSDTYGGGELFFGEFGVSKSWIGSRLSYGHFQSQSTFIFSVPIENSGLVLEIPFEEMAVMQIADLSLAILPIQKKWVETEMLFGIAYAKAENSCFKSVEYSYSTLENKFTSLTRDYQLVRNKHFGYQAGINLIFYPFKKMGFKIDLHLYDLSHGGTFFFVGTGLSFRLL